jgi:hydrogenase small subunit
MPSYTRRDVLRMGACLATGLGLGGGHHDAMAAGLDKILSGHAKVLWLHGMSCSGCSVSFLNSDNPGPLEILTEIISLVYHPTVSAAQGDTAMGLIDQLSDEGGYFLVVEGAIPTKMDSACVVGGKPLGQMLPPLIKNAAAVVAAGTCASFGGIPAAEGNVTGAVGMKEFMESKNISTEGCLINCPGCPVHPQSLLGVVAYVLAKGLPQLDPELLTPEMFYKNSVHDECPRFHDWERRHFAQKFGEEGCLFELGCLGPLSRTACPRRQWNSGVNWCIRAGAPCTACSSADFAKRRDFPFYRKGEKVHTVAYHENDRKGTES